MSLGFQRAGFDIQLGIDHWQPAVDTYKANFDHVVLQHDLSNVDGTLSVLADYNIDLIIGGPPCQDFSTAGHQDETRGRAALSISFAETVAAIKPAWFVMENVATAYRYQSFQNALQLFSSNGYGLSVVTLDAALCGVPQKRKRLFVIGELGGENARLEKALIEGQDTKPLTMREYFGNELEIEHYFRVPTNYSRRGVFSVDEPSMTIRGVERPIPPGYKGHPNDSAPISSVRTLTVSERSRVQTFPKGFKFCGSKSDQNQLIGNAVPVNLAAYVAETLRNHICVQEVTRHESN